MELFYHINKSMSRKKIFVKCKIWDNKTVKFCENIFLTYKFDIFVNKKEVAYAEGNS